MPDAPIKPNAAPHIGHICPNTLTQPSNLVHKRNPGGEKGIRGVLGHLSAAIIHEQDRILCAYKRPIQLLHD